MEKPEINFKLELLANLMQQLSYWAQEPSYVDEQTSELEFDRTLAAIYDMREALIEDLDGYFEHCKTNNEPIYLPYWTVRKELRQYRF